MDEREQQLTLRAMNREVIEAMKRLKQGVEGVEQRVPEIIGGDDFSDDEDDGVEVFKMEAELDPKFLNMFSTDYKYEELTDEQKEIHDMLFNAGEAELIEEGEMMDEKHELDDIIGQAKGSDIKLKELTQEDKEKKAKLEEKDRLEKLELERIKERVERAEKEEKKKKKRNQEHQDLSTPVFGETAEEKMFRQIINKPEKKVRFEEMDEDEDEEYSDEEQEEESEEDFLAPKKEPKEINFGEDDFPHIGILNDMVPDEEEEIDEPHNLSEDDKELQNQIEKEEMLEKEFREVLSKEYTNSNEQDAEKKLTAKEFDAIINSHLNSMPAAKKSALKASSEAEKKPEVVTKTTQGGGQITFYFGGAKPTEDKSKKKKQVSTGVKSAIDDKAMAELKSMMQAKVSQNGGMVMETGEEIDEEWEEGEEEEFEGEEEEDEDGEEEEEEELNAEEKYEKMLEDMQLLESLPLCMRIERDEKLPDEMNGLKVFKRKLLPDLKYKDDIAAQQVLNQEEISDSEIDPPGFNQPSIRSAIVESNIQPKVMTKSEAIGKATIVRETKNGKKKSKKYKGKEKKEEEKEPEAEVEEEDDEETEEFNIARQKNETPEERKARKDLIKKMKSERKNKKKNFKEKYENMKKGYLHQNRAQTDGTQGVPVYRIN